MATIADLGARLVGFSLEHPEPERIASLMRDLSVDRPPDVTYGPVLRYRAQIETPGGPKQLT